MAIPLAAYDPIRRERPKGFVDALINFRDLRDAVQFSGSETRWSNLLIGRTEKRIRQLVKRQRVAKDRFEQSRNPRPGENKCLQWVEPVWKRVDLLKSFR
jgi:hypothetical protein